MRSWKKARLGDFAEVLLGKMLDKAKNKGELHPYLSNKDVRWGSFDTHDLSMMRFEEDEHERFGLKHGDIVVCEGGQPGRCAIWKDQLQDMKIQKALHRVRVNADYSNEFVYYRFLLAGRSGQLEKYLIGSTIKHITGVNLKQVEFEYPDLQEQQRIASVLSALDDKIALNTRISAELEAMAKLLYDYWFVQFDFPNAKGKPYKSSGGAMVHNAELKREVPKRWEVVALDDLVNCFDNERVPLEKSVRAKRPGDIPYYGATGIFDFIDEHIFAGEYVLIAEDGSIMDDKGWPIVQFISGKAWINNHAHVLQSKAQGHNEFIFQRLKKIPVVTVMTGSIQKKITGGNLLGYRIAYPGDKIVSDYCEAVKPMRATIFNLERQNQELTTLRDWLLPMLMNGQVRVSTALDVTPAKEKVGLAMAAEPQAPYGLKVVHRKFDWIDQVTFNAWMVHKANKDRYFGRTKAEKVEHMIECVIGHDHERHPVRDAAGPVDWDRRLEVEKDMVEKGWARVEPIALKNGKTMNLYHSVPRTSEVVKHVEELLGSSLGEVERIIQIMRPLNTQQCEVRATLYSAWNDLLRAKKPHSDEDIIHDVLHNWHIRKNEVPDKEWPAGLKWLRSNGLVPTGKAKPVKAKKGRK